MTKKKLGQMLVVGIGASAGGVSALKRVFSEMKKLTAAIIVIQHSGVEGKELAREVLQQFTDSPVEEAIHGAGLQSGKVYFCPPHKLVSVENGQFFIQDIFENSQKFSTIDWCMQSLASEYKEHAIGILLSGEGMDGALGLKAISENGGLSIAQDPNSAEHPSMPQSATDLSLVDHICLPEKMGEVLEGHEKFIIKLERESAMAHLQEEIGAAIISICDILLKHSQHDFKHYKTSTMVRRIQRRMLVLQLASVDEYVSTLNTNRQERDALFNDLLINVTSFFRDPEAFEALKHEVLIPELKKNPEKKKFRIWVAGCSTGEEAYTLAILIREIMAEMQTRPEVQIIATDIDEDALNTARRGEYPLSISDRVSPQRLENFFQRRNGRFVVNKQLRELILFSSHNLITDPPFSQLDLISCRNVLIYLGLHLQKKLIPVFHYALKPNGHLFMGTSEALGTHRDLFHNLNVKYRIAQRRATAIQSHSPSFFTSLSTTYTGHFKEAPKGQEEDLHLIGQRIILDEFSPRFAIIGEDGQILSVSAGIQEYFEPNEGAFQNNILKLVTQSIRSPLRASINEAKKQKRQIQNQSCILRTARGLVKLGLVVQPMPQLGEHTGLYMVIFRDLGIVAEEHFAKETSSQVDYAMVEELERELARLREELDKSIQDLEASNEELKSSNEELLSMNEELQSANEELEISKEEVQRSNDILQNANNDLENLLHSTKIATIFLDDKLNIMNFTPAIQQIYDLVPHDIGRPITSFASKAHSMPPYSFPKDLGPDKVLETEVVMPNGQIFLRRKSAYMDSEKKQIGLVITFVDISELRQTESLFKTLADTVPEMIWSTDEKGNYVYFSERWMEFSGISPLTVANKGFREIIHPDDVDSVVKTWTEAQKDKTFFSYECRMRDKFGVYHWHLVMARALKDKTGRVYRWFGSCTNIQKQKEMEMSILSSRQELQRNQDRFNKVAGAVELGVWYCNLPFDVLNWSDTVKKHFWMDAHETVTISDFFNRLHPDDREPTREAIDTAIKNHDHYDVNYRTVHPRTGAIKWIKAVGWTDYEVDGTPVRFDGVTLDITKEVLYMENLRDSEWRYSMASKAARELIWDWDLSNNKVMWNEAITSEFGYGQENMNTDAHWWISRVHPEDRERISDGIHHSIDSGENHWSDEYRFLKADGNYAVVEDRGFIQHNEHGKAMRMIGTMNDITERNEYLAGMKEAIKARDEFLSIASHELKTPLTSMVLQLQMLKKRIDRGDATTVMINKANDLALKQCRLLTSLIDDMLDVSRIANGKMNFNFEETSLRSIVSSALESFSANAEEKNIQVVTEISSDINLMADPFRLEQVVYNLLSNAIKYGKGKPIKVRVYQEESKRGVIEVTDQGLGIPSESIEKIFNLFERAVSSLNISGLGLGLFISKQIVDAHSGEIEVESQMDQGSTFKIILPLA